jgi:uncharacterized protein (TIGR03437 family)
MFFFVAGAHAATFGTVIPIPGQISDIALDNRRGVVYAANFTANRIEQISMGTRSLGSSIHVAPQPSSLAVSSDGHYLVVGHYAASATADVSSAGLSVVDLNAGNSVRPVSLGGASVLAVAFGNGSQALVIHTAGVSLFDPASGTLTNLDPSPFAGAPLPVSWATFPPQAIQASAGVSGDGNIIYAAVGVGASTSQIVRYDVNAGAISVGSLSTTPSLGPLAVSVDQTGSTFLAGWGLANASLMAVAQFPYAPGDLNIGGHAFDAANNLIYAQVPLNVASSGPPLLHVLDSDNLTVRERFQLRENLAGKALVGGGSMYAISDSGVTIFPIGALSTVHRVQALQEDLLFQGSGCDQKVVTQFLDIVDPSGGSTDFALKVSSPGVTLSAISGTTPAHIQVRIDPSLFQNQKGTSVVQLQISSTQAVNVAQPVRLLVNTRDPDQQGVIHNVPGKIVDVLADPARDRFYAIRQDKNQVLVFDGTTFTQIATLRTGNTPVQMAIYQEGPASWLLVTNDNSQLISVFNLDTLQPSSPILLPGGLYARSIAASSYLSRILATTRPGTAATGPVLRIDFASRLASAPSTIGIFKNDVDVASALTASPSGRTMFMAMPDGTVALYDSDANAFISSRKNPAALAGAYAALSDDLFVADRHVFNSAMVEVGAVDLLGGTSSGAGIMGNRGLMSMVPASPGSGTIEQFSMDQFASMWPMREGEAATTRGSLIASPVDQTGQTILAFMRTLAPLANGNFIVQLSTSGFMAVPATFGAAQTPPAITGVTSAADGSAGVAPGGLITIWGSNLSSSTAQASEVPLANGLGGVCLYANSLAMPLLFVSPNQINAQLPYGVPGNASISISSAAGQSDPFTFTVQPTAPAVFRTGDGTPVIIRTVDGKMITDATPIHLNQVLNIYMTGLGAVNAAATAGSAGPSNPPAATMTAPEITIGGASIFTLWSGLAPGLVGVNQVNAQVPFHHIPTGSKVPFTIKQGDASTTVYLHVEE